MTVLTIAVSALLIGAPAVNAATPSTPPAKPPGCIKALAALPSWMPDLGNRASCQARTMWVKIDAEARAVLKEKNADKRAKLNAKYYWAVAGPLLNGAKNDDHWKSAFNSASFRAQMSNGSPEMSQKFLIVLRDFVDRNSRNYTQMKSSVLMLDAINTLEIGKNLPKSVPSVTRNIVKKGLQGANLETPLQVIASASIPLVKDINLETARKDLFITMQTLW